MKHLLVVFAVLNYLEACPPTQAPIATSGTTAKAATQAGGSQAKTATTTAATIKKREVGEIRLILISSQAFDSSLNDNYLRLFRAVVDAYFRRNLINKKDLVTETVKNENGKLAVIYNMIGVDCKTVENFAREAKSSQSFVKTIKLKCGDETEMEMN